MNVGMPSKDELVAELARVRERLAEAEETLAAIRNGEVDAVVVSGAAGSQVYTLTGGDHPYRVLVEAMNEGAATLSETGSILYCNSRMADILSLPLEKVIGASLLDSVIPEDRPLLRSVMEQCLAEGSCRSEVHLLGASGSVPVQLSCRALQIEGVSCIAAVLTELTEQKRNEQLLESERLATSILEQAGEAIVVCDGNGRIIRASAAAHVLCGRNIMMEKFDIAFPLHLAEEDRPLAVAEALSGAGLKNIEVFCRKGDLPVHLLCNSRPLKSDESGIIGCIITLADISERKLVEESLEQRVQERTAELAEAVETLKAEVVQRKKARQAVKKEMTIRMQAMEELREKERLLIQQSRQAAMGEMIGNIAHQWRQPLNTLGLYIQELPIVFEMGGFTKGYLDGTVEKSMQLVFHMSQTIDDFRNFFKPNKEKVSFPLRDTIQSTVSLVEKSFSYQGIEICCAPGEGIYVEGYLNEFSQVLLNIMNNAKDVFIDRNIEHPILQVESFLKGKKAVVTVTDNGGGVPENIIDSLFDPYFTTKGPLGTGVGLFMSKVIIEKSMNGKLTVNNTGNGAEFRIEVPQAPPPGESLSY